MMNSIARLMSRPKARMGLTLTLSLVWTLVAVVAVLAWGHPAGVVALVLTAVCTGFLVALRGVASVVDQREVTKLHQRLQNVESLVEGTRKYASQTEYRTRSLEGFGNQLQRQQNSLSALQAESKALPAAVVGGVVNASSAQAGSDASSRPRDLFSPSAIPAVLPDKRSAETVGRAAAAVADDPRRAGILAELLGETDQGEDTDRPLVAVVGDRRTRQALETVARVHALAPSASAVPAEASYAVVDLAGTRTGRWSGMLESTGTTIYRPLADELTAARRRGTVVLVVEDGLPTGNFGPDLLSRSTLTLCPGDSVQAELDAWANDISTPVLDRLRELQQQRGPRKALA